jgi:hypothetical protein
VICAAALKRSKKNKMTALITIDIPASLATLLPTPVTVIELAMIIAFWLAVALVLYVLYVVISWLDRIQKRLYTALFHRPFGT